MQDNELQLLEFYKIAQNKTALVVEDNRSILTQIRDVLSELLIEVTTANDGQEALDIYKETLKNGKEFDVVITDIQMPNMNGIELIKEITELHKEQTVVVVSAHSDSDYLIELINMGVFRFIPKPIEHHQFMRSLYEAFEGSLSKQQSIKNELSHIYIKNILVWDKEYQTLTQEGVGTIKLSKNERALMALLLSNTQKIYTVEEIIEHVWQGDNENIDRSNVKFLINRIRKKLPIDCIENLYSLGYKVVL